MKISSAFARALVPLFVVALLAGSATPALGIADNTNFPKCADANDGNCITSLTVGGTGTDPTNDAGVDVNAFFTGGMLQVQVVDGGASGTAAFDLDGVGVTTSTVIVVELTVGNSFDPVLVVGASLIDSWTWDDATNKLTLTAKPRAVSFTTGTCDLDADCADANFDFDAMLSVALDDDDVSSVPAGQQAQVTEFLTAFRGGFVATNAQTFSIPSYNSSSGTLQFDLGAPHLKASTALNTGFFNVFIPDDVITDIWDLSASSLSLSATSDGSSVGGTLTHVTGGDVDGWLFESATISFSTPTISLKPASSSAVVEEEKPRELDLSKGSATTPTTARVPVVLPDSGEFTREVTLSGPGATLEFEKGTTVTVGGAPFTGTIEPPQRIQGRPSGLRSAVSITATGDDADADSVSALADGDIVFDPPVTITIVDTSDDAAKSRVVRIAPDGSITDLAGTMTGRGVTAQITGLGTYGLATELDLAEITSAPSISVGLPVRLPADGIIGFATTIKNDSAALGFTAGTAVTDSAGSAFTGTLTAPAAASAPAGVGSTVDVSTVASGARFSQPATLSVFAPADVAAGDSALVSISGTATTCLTSTLATDLMSRQTTLTSPSGVFGLALPVVADPQVAIREPLTAAGLHSQWAGQSATPLLCAGQVAELAVRLRNTGTEAWTVGGKRALLALNPGLGTAAVDSGLVTPLYDTRLATHDADVLPGDVATFRLKVRAPATAGTHLIHIRPVIEGHTWLEDEGIHLLLTVR